MIAGVALEQWRASRPDADEDGFDDRYVQAGTTFGGAGVIRGNLTPECAAAVQAVLEALGKKAGAEDTRTEGQRFHDALQQGCELLIGAKMVPDRAGADTHVAVHIPFPELRQRPGAPEAEEVWLRGTAGEPGYLTGRTPRRPPATRSPNRWSPGTRTCGWSTRSSRLALAAAGITLDGADPDPAGDGDDDDAGPDDTSDGGHRSWGIAGGGPRAASRARSRARERFTPDAAQALRYAIARLAIDFVSGPAGLAGWLRTTLLAPPVQHAVAAAGHRLLRLHPGQHPPRRPAPRPRLRLAPLRKTRRLVRRAPPAAQERRRQNRRQRLRAAVPVPPRRLHPPPRLAARPAPRRHHHRLRTRRAGAAQPLTTHHPRRVNPVAS